MSRLFAVLVLTFLIVLAACGGSDKDDGDAMTGGIDGVETCEQLADVAIGKFQEMLDGLSEVTIADIQSETTPEAFVGLEEDGKALGAKAEDLGCSDEDMARMMDERAGELTAEGPVAELMLQELQSGNFFQDIQ